MAILDDLKRGAVRALLNLEVIALLRSPAVAKIDFRYGTFAVRGDDYHRLADDIARGAVGVFADTLLPGSGAEYHPTSRHPHPNALVLPRDWIMIGANLWRQMGVIHEATHALQDKAARNMNHVAAEAPAFVAEALFVLLAGKTHVVFDPIGKHAKYNETRVVFRRAWGIALEVVGPPSRRDVPAWRVEHLNRAVHGHSLYDRRRLYTFDGF